MEENYAALMLAVLSPEFLTPDAAMLSLERGRIIRLRARKGPTNAAATMTLTEVDTAFMAEMKSTMTYQQIGDMYGMTADAVYHRIKRSKSVVA
jgi:hypothetical protein